MTISGLRLESAGVPPAPANPEPARGKPEPAAHGAFSKALAGLGRVIDVGEAQVEAATHFRDYDTATLIALQAGIYRYTEAVDLASKIVDRATSAVRTVLQGSGH